MSIEASIMSGATLLEKHVDWPTESGFTVFDSFASNESELAATVLRIAEQQGQLVPGRFGRRVERVVPTTLDDALPGSLSAKYGTGELPFHSDSAHRIIPSKTLILACAHPGDCPSPTRLLDGHDLQMSPAERGLLSSAVFFIRTGRHSFYSSILSEQSDFIRFDPGCMEPTDKRAEAAMAMFEAKLASVNRIEISWTKGRILLVDNWRMLHARGSTNSHSGRILLRSSVE